MKDIMLKVKVILSDVVGLTSIVAICLFVYAL